MADYIALRRMAVQELNGDGSNKLGADGRPVTRQCEPGDPLPEALHWGNLHREVRAGRVGLAGIGHQLTGPALAESIRGKIIEDGKRNQATATAAKAAKSEAPKKAERKRRAHEDARATQDKAAAVAIENATGQQVAPTANTDGERGAE